MDIKMNFHENLGLNDSAIKSGLGTKIESVGIYIPEQRVSSEEIVDYVDSESNYGIPKDWMSTEMGILERRMSDENALPSGLAIAACEDALRGIDKNELDVVIFCDIEHNQPEPDTAHRIQKTLGLTANYAFDMANACFGFFDSLRIASSLIESKAARKVLIATGEVQTKITRQVMEQLKNGIPVNNFETK
ncbi:MAG: 3-oxoacyl-[acyl-carrier-protein] synthase III [Arenicella sp.]|jgi:3-oxoacyl-[acyl-carrier-protein] synthase III